MPIFLRRCRKVYREAFNHTYAAQAGEQRQEAAAHRIARAAKKRAYVNGRQCLDAKRSCFVPVDKIRARTVT